MFQENQDFSSDFRIFKSGCSPFKLLFFNYFFSENDPPIHFIHINPLNPGHFYEFRKFIKISPVGNTKWNQFIQEESHLKLMAKNTSLLTKNTTFEHKFHIDTSRENGG
jgi:hypothetical protein